MRKTHDDDDYDRNVYGTPMNECMICDERGLRKMRTMMMMMMMMMMMALWRKEHDEIRVSTRTYVWGFSVSI